MNERKQKYIIVDGYNLQELNQKYKEGYTLKNVVQETEYSPSYDNVNGSFMNNPISLQLPWRQIRTKYLMELEPVAETLYGEKRDTGSSESVNTQKN